jgi:predicted molibdopterin-dependent oxidoreductase YjgC
MIDQVMSGSVPAARARELEVRTKTPTEEALASWLRDRDRLPSGRMDVHAPLTLADLQQEADRCLSCDCQHREGCKLRIYADRYGASKSRSHGGDPMLVRRPVGSHTLFEPGKCIRCGICVAIAEARGEPVGVTFLGRGFDVRVDLPVSSSHPRGLECSATECIHACPTGALIDANAIAWSASSAC